MHLDVNRTARLASLQLTLNIQYKYNIENGLSIAIMQVNCMRRIKNGS